MRFKLFLSISIISSAVMLSGCVSIKAHVADRERVDQDLPAGAEQLQPNRAKTRQVIVVEVAQKVKMEDESGKGTKTVPAASTAEGQTKVVAEPRGVVVSHDANFTFPGKDAGSLKQPGGVSPSAVEQYTVQKDDTMQKISKKLLGSYSKWTIIYDANRDVINDPNFLKPGTVLKIPLAIIPVDQNYPPAEGPVDNK